MHGENKMKDELGDGIFPNWIGPQRFGSGRPVTPIVGRHVVNGNWKSAVMDYLSMEGDENEEVQAFRKQINQTNRSKYSPNIFLRM